MNCPLPLRNSLAAAAYALMSVIFTSAPCTGTDFGLQIEALTDRFDFALEGASSSPPWVLQHSPDLESWDDLLLFDEFVIGGGAPRVSIPRNALPEAGALTGYFRARQLKADDPTLREFLAARVRWRQSGIGSYEYELQQDLGAISWLGRITVMDGAVSIIETIDLQPPFADVPEVPTIDELFERVADALASDADEIVAVWHPELGYPVRCMIDPVALIADDEESWTIRSFTPSP
jgi:hypothetical protein